MADTELKPGVRAVYGSRNKVGPRPAAEDWHSTRRRSRYSRRTERACSNSGYSSARASLTGISCSAKPDGEPCHPERVYQAFKRALRKHGLPDLPIHGLRHTRATLALEADIHPKIVSERLGHSKIAITLDMYSQSSPVMHQAAAERVASLITLR